MTVRAALERAEDCFGRRGVETPRVDAELLLGHVVGLTRTELALEAGRGLEAPEQEEFDRLVERRAAREPLAYVLGEWCFRRLTLKTDRRALVPRPETEVVVERCLRIIEPLAAPDVLDVGTGTGAIALAIADEHPGARVTAVDDSSEALALARENLGLTGLADRVRLVEGDLVRGLPGGPYDLVVSNPPYVHADELPLLAPEVREWEPRAAIVDTGQTRAVVGAAPNLLRPGAFLVLETHWQGAHACAKLLRTAGFAAVTISRDLAGRERVVEGRRP